MHSILSVISTKIRELKTALANLSLNTLVDVDTPSPMNLGVLQYDGFQQKWVAAPPEEIGAVLDGGGAGVQYVDVLTVDGGGA